ncbi:probable serine/threonine-protein kinase PkwA [Sycon ciliatum]|uniref:probable serine/threonine-protein kinase PkwA n=1 Tax=Sycon ciliatum TaxID=27933 RepID=UPI0031F69AE5
MDNSRKAQLILQWLKEHGYKQTAESLKAECTLNVDSTTAKTGALDEIFDLHAEAEVSHLRSEEKVVDYVQNGDGVHTNQECLSLDSWTGGVPVLCSRLTPQGWLLLSCARKLQFFGQLKLPIGSSAAGIPSKMLRHGGGVLGVAQHPKKANLVLSNSMDKSCRLMDMTALFAEEGSGEVDDVKDLQVLSDHSKYVVKAVFSACGRWLATASYDHTVCIYSADSDDFTFFQLRKQTSFRGSAETLCWHPTKPLLVVAVRNDHMLHTFSCSDDAISKDSELNLNALGDNYVSFTALDITFDPSGNLLSVATDKDRVILVHATSGKQLANLYGCSNDEYSQPRHCWHPSGMYIYCTSQDKCIIVWEVATQREVARLVGHTGMLRDVSYSPELDVLVSSAMDGVVKIWKHSPNGVQAVA